MAAADKHSKTEAPTPKRVKEARDKGQVAKSPELTTWLAVLIATYLLPPTVRHVAEQCQLIFRSFAEVTADPTPSRMTRALGAGLQASFLTLLPLMVGLMVMNVVVGLAQVGLHPSTKRLKPNFKAVDPKAGFKRMFSSQNAWETGKSVVKVVVIAGFAYPATRQMVEDITGGSALSYATVMPLIARRSIALVRLIGWVSLVIAAADLIYKKRKHRQNLKMSKDEVKDEAKNAEGNPEVKNKMKSKMFTMSRTRMLQAVARADVVVVNPVHIAVALQYEAARGAPRVVAKGIGELAERIKERAEQSEVTIVESIPLARALYKACDLDDEIPVELYEGVARLLAFVHRLRRRRLLGGDYHRLPDSLTMV